MIGGLISDVVLIGAVVLIFGGFYFWARRRGLVTAEPTARPQADGSPARRHISLLTEAVAYAGTILLLAGGAAAIRQQWHHFTNWEQVAVFAGAAAVFLVAGAAVRRVQEPAVQRLVGVLWFVSSAGIAVAAALTVSDVYEKSGGVVVLTVGLVLTVYSAALWLVRRRALQCVALFTGLVVTITGTIETVASHPGVALALALWGFGLVWAILGWRRYVEPLWVAAPLGVLLALIAPAFAVADHGWVYAIAIGTAAAIMAISVPLRNTVLLGLGTVATFGYVTATVVRYFQDSLGVPATLAVTGLLILGLALVTARLMRVARHAKHQAPAAAGQGPTAGENPAAGQGPTAGENPAAGEKPTVGESPRQRHFRKAS